MLSWTHAKGASSAVFWVARWPPHGRSRQARCNLTEFDALKPGTAGAKAASCFFPGSTEGDREMYKSILIPTDGSELANKAVQHGIALSHDIGAKITVLTVTVPFHILTTDPKMIEDTAAQYELRMEKHAAKVLEAAANAAKAAGVACDTVHVEHEHPYQAINDTASSKGCDLIVMASHGRRGVSALVLGSETVKVLTHCKIPVLVYR
jgi:nucleotide-binding universal stress UspA family protein